MKTPWLALFALTLCTQIHADISTQVTPTVYETSATVTYADFSTAMDEWVQGATGSEKERRQKIVDGLNQVMSAHNFNDQGVTFSQFQRYLKKPYKPNLRDIYYVLTIASQVEITPDDVSEICQAAGIPPIAADTLDLIVSGLIGKITDGNLTPLDIALFQSEVNWLTGNNSSKITIDDFFQRIEADPEQDCDGTLRNLDPIGVTEMQNVIRAAVPTWTPPTLDYASFDKNLNAWIAFKFTDEASKAVAQQEIVTQVLNLMNIGFRDQLPFPEFQQELLKTEPIWGGPILYFSLSKFTSDDTDNLPVPTDAIDAIFRCAGLNIEDGQPNDIDRIYTDLLSHQNGGTAGSQLTDDDVQGYTNILNYITTDQGKTFADVKAYIATIFSGFSDYAKQDLLAIMDPEHNPRPYHYGEDIQYFRNDQKLLPLHPEDPQYYREHVIPSLGIGRYSGADNVGRYRYVSGKGGEFYVTVHYNQFLRVDQLVAAVKNTGALTQEDVNSWMSLYTDSTSPLYDKYFYKEIEDLAQISGVTTQDLLNLSGLDSHKAAQILSLVTNVFLIIQANPAPTI